MVYTMVYNIIHNCMYTVKNGQLSVPHRVAAAISAPSILLKCQNARPSLTSLSAKRKYLSIEHTPLASATIGSIARWYKESRRSLCHSLSVLVHADPFKMGRHASGRQAKDRPMTLLSLFKQPTAMQIACYITLHVICYIYIMYHVTYQQCYKAGYIACYIPCSLDTVLYNTNVIYHIIYHPLHRTLY